MLPAPPQARTALPMGILSIGIMMRWTSLDFEVEQAEIAVESKTTMMKRNRNLRVFENILGLQYRIAQ